MRVTRVGAHHAVVGLDRGVAHHGDRVAAAEVRLDGRARHTQRQRRGHRRAAGRAGLAGDGLGPGLRCGDVDALERGLGCGSRRCHDEHSVGNARDGVDARDIDGQAGTDADAIAAGFRLRRAIGNGLGVGLGRGGHRKRTAGQRHVGAVFDVCTRVDAVHLNGDGTGYGVVGVREARMRLGVARSQRSRCVDLETCGVHRRPVADIRLAVVVDHDDGQRRTESRGLLLGGPRDLFDLAPAD